MNSYSVVLTDEINLQLIKHLVRSDGQEDLCFATYKPSIEANRTTGIISHIILPQSGEREVNGNVCFLPCYFERVLKIASERNEGVILLHSHLGPGWQGMSEDDIIAENRIAPATFAVTNLPLLGMTVGTDGSWSARFWEKDLTEKRKYARNWAETVRVIGKGLSITFNDNLVPPNFDAKKQLRTISAWGKKTQEDISRLRIGIVGLGSVGSIVAEILARTGVSNFTLIDFDSVEEKNLDRLTNVFKKDIGKSKVSIIGSAIKKSATSPNISITCCEYSICEEEGYKTALNCDIIFCCVDRPWGRQVLNFIAYAHLIPVIDGGILVRSNKNQTRIIGADWKAQTIGYKRACLECLGQYSSENATLEKQGFLDDPSYFKGLDKLDFINAHENVFAFSSHLASMEVLQMLSLFVSPSEISDVGQQLYHFVTGRMDISENLSCHENCCFPSLLGKGDNSGIEIFSEHKIAEAFRISRLKNKPKKS